MSFIDDVWIHPHVQVSARRFQRLFGDRPPALLVLDVLARLAAALLDEHAAGNSDCAVPLRGLPRLFMKESADILAAAVDLDDAREAVAVEHGFGSWDDVTAGCERRLDPAFEEAADAIAAGDLGRLRERIDAAPELVHARSPYGHRCTLLHYGAANGIEMRRQSSPRNLAEIVALLLDRGSQVDAIAATYSGDVNQTPLSLLVTSAHPALAGTQAAVVHLLLEHGAAVDGVDGSGAPLRFAMEFGHDAAVTALLAGGAKVQGLVVAAGLGVIDRVESSLGSSDPAERARALVRAAQHGQTSVVSLLLDRGVDPTAAPYRGVTALHEAAYGGHADTVEILLSHGADANALDDVHGTAPAVWAAVAGHDGLATRLRAAT